MPAKVTVILNSSDGKQERIEFQPLKTDDPAIAERLASGGDPAQREFITTFRRAARRPASYPADLPFVSGATPYVNEYADPSRRPRARWRARLSTDRVFNSIVHQSAEAGWNQDEAIPPIPALARATRTVFLRRGSEIRRVSQYKLGWLTSLVELEDVPDTHFQNPGIARPR